MEPPGQKAGGRRRIGGYPVPRNLHMSIQEMGMESGCPDNTCGSNLPNCQGKCLFLVVTSGPLFLTYSLVFNTIFPHGYWFLVLGSPKNDTCAPSTQIPANLLGRYNQESDCFQDRLKLPENLYHWEIENSILVHIRLGKENKTLLSPKAVFTV